jgi:SAM-dependent methyltransferase
MAYDVEILNELGYDVYGFDPGNRTNIWLKHRNPATYKKLRIAFSGDTILKEFENSFDYMYALEVIEHVGCKNGGGTLTENYLQERIKFMEGCLDLLKFNGKLLISTSNRLCPIDIGHGHDYIYNYRFFAKTYLNLTFPLSQKNFVCSFSDISKYLDQTKYKGQYSIKALSSVNYLSNSSNRNKIAFYLFNTYLKIVNVFIFRTSFLNPILVVEITKKA